MAVVINMPKLGSTMDSGTISKWHKQEGEWVNEGEVLVTIESEKLSSDYPSPKSGVLFKILHGEGDEVEIIKPICVFADQNESNVDLSALLGIPAPAAPVSTTPEPAAINGTVPVAVSGGRKEATPIARKIAKENGVDIDAVTGTGPNGRVTREDVEKYIEDSKKPEASPSVPEASGLTVREVIPLSGMRKVIARRMMESITAPQMATWIDIDMTEALKAKKALSDVFKETYGVGCSVTAILIKRLQKALEQYPVVNAHYINDQIITYENINIGMAAAVDMGVIVPVVRDVQKKNLLEICREVTALSEKARENQLTMSDMENRTVTLTNTGMYGTDGGVALLNLPDTSIIAIGAIIKKAVVLENDQIAARPMLKVSIYVDHRAIDGAYAGSFLSYYKKLLQAPAEEQIIEMLL